MSIISEEKFGIKNQESGMTHSFKVFLGRYHNIGIRGNNTYREGVTTFIEGGGGVLHL